MMLGKLDRYVQKDETTCFSLAAFKILSMSLNLVVLIKMCRPLWVQLVLDSLSFLDLCVFFLHQIREVLVITFSNRFLIPCSFSSPSGIPTMQMLVHFILSKMFLKLFSFTWILFSLCCSNTGLNFFLF